MYYYILCIGTLFIVLGMIVNYSTDIDTTVNDIIEFVSGKNTFDAYILVNQYPSASTRPPVWAAKCGFTKVFDPKLKYCDWSHISPLVWEILLNEFLALSTILTDDVVESCRDKDIHEIVAIVYNHSNDTHTIRSICALVVFIIHSSTLETTDVHERIDVYKNIISKIELKAHEHYIDLYGIDTS